MGGLTQLQGPTPHPLPGHAVPHFALEMEDKSGRIWADLIQCTLDRIQTSAVQRRYCTGGWVCMRCGEASELVSTLAERLHLPEPRIPYRSIFWKVAEAQLAFQASAAPHSLMS